MVADSGICVRHPKQLVPELADPENLPGTGYAYDRRHHFTEEVSRCSEKDQATVHPQDFDIRADTDEPADHLCLRIPDNGDGIHQLHVDHDKSTVVIQCHLQRDECRCRELGR